MLLNARVPGEVTCQLTAKVKSERCRPAGLPPEGGETIGPTRTNTVGCVFFPRHTGISSCRKNTPSEGPKLAWGCADPNFSAGRRPTSESSGRVRRQAADQTPGKIWYEQGTEQSHSPLASLMGGGGGQHNHQMSQTAHKGAGPPLPRVSSSGVSRSSQASPTSTGLRRDHDGRMIHWHLKCQCVSQRLPLGSAAAGTARQAG